MSVLEKNKKKKTKLILMNVSSLGQYSFIFECNLNFTVCKQDDIPY